MRGTQIREAERKVENLPRFIFNSFTDNVEENPHGEYILRVSVLKILKEAEKLQ